MPPLSSTSLTIILIALVAIIIAIATLMRMNRKARVVEDGSAPALGRDVLDEGAAPAARNQALIDAPRAVEIIEGDLSAMANAQDTAAAPLGTDAEAGPQVAADPAPLPTPGSGDDLTRIKGLGPKIAALLAQLGITRFAQIAAWTSADIERIDAQLGRFSGRITRDQWVEQARLLSAGDETSFAAQFGNNG